ncbi:hypothetical protein BJ322DRAFT_1021286 [Thelephora terrestris]|uniref:F-box domain-containing protein n=1 Tax=Thelephora terrestris TaxID=56493 RepID=A0A9P6L6M6_9AGAM|nr:hypothetical protein BJ322DRAFT_1021286 [Thelephora terrestris]
MSGLLALEKQIREHKSAIIKPKRARNSLLNVLSLPLEVLSNIFRRNITPKQPSDNLEDVSHNFFLVCHHWFKVASQTPGLWTFWGNNFFDWKKRKLTNFYATCSNELTSSPNSDVIHAYDVLYVHFLFSQAVCTKGDSGNYCVLEVGSTLNTTDTLLSTAGSAGTDPANDNGKWHDVSHGS